MNKLGIVGLVLFFSCQSSKELHFIKQYDNYYRLKINQHAFLTSSRYMSGKYDENSVDYFFGEIGRPDSSKIVKKETFLINQSGNEIPLDKTLMFILSTNSEEVADQIGNFASNEETLQLIARLSNREVETENKKLLSEKVSQEIKVNDLFVFGDEIMNSLNVENTEETRSLLITFLNYLAASRGKKTGFQNIEDAENWFYDEF